MSQEVQPVRTAIRTALALGALAATACVEPPDDADAPPRDEDGGAITRLSGDRVDLFGAFEAGNTWPKDDFTVCWLDELANTADPDVATLMEAGKAAVMKEWNRVGRVRFDPWWPGCSARPDSDIRIGPEAEGETRRGRSEIGTDALGVNVGIPTMTLNFAPVPEGSCSPGAGNECNAGSSANNLDAGDIADFEHVILHEFGHALGLRHEHARDDNTCVLPGGVVEHLDQNSLDGEPLWAFDSNSVMSYCAYGNKLSVGDIRALHSLYPGVVGLYTDNDLASGTSGVAQPLWLGPGYYTTAQVAVLPTISGIVVPPGYRVRVCTTSSCAYLTSTARTLSSTYNDRLVNLEIAPWVVGAADVGYGGTTELFGVGPRSAGTFQVLGDNTMSSVFVPPTRAATVCATSTGGAPCAGSHVGGGIPTAFKLPVGVDNAVSYVSVAARVVTYSSAFRRDSYALAPGTYKASTNAPWLTAVRALSIAGLDVRACTLEGSSTLPGGGGGGDCRTYTQSVDLAAAAHTGLRYLKISVPIVIAQ